jgi:hypothetical protein
MMSGWITSLLVKVVEMKPRVALLKRFIDIADCCFNLNNFNSVIEIVSGLQTTSVRRLTDTFDFLSDETKATFQRLKEFLDTRKNWENYRTRLRHLTSVSEPCLPYLGIYLTDLTMIDEASKKTVPHPAFPGTKLLNFERAAKIASIHSEIRKFQTEKYCLSPVSYFQEYLSRLDQLSEEECFRLSQQIQPRAE